MEEKKIVTLKIDGNEVKAPRGTPVIKLAAQLGIRIPTLCHWDFLEPYGSCRVCSVEMRKGRKKRLVTACNYPAQEGEEIFTNTDWVIENRKLILELLLARCPEVDVIKALAEEYGVKETRFKKLNETCIGCGLCVRMCSEVVQANAIGWEGRGVHREICTPFEIDTEACIGCGACAAVCPTKHIRIEPSWERPGETREFTLGPDSAIYIPSFQAVPKIPVIDEEACIHFKTGGCKICERVCEPMAINHKQESRYDEFEVGQILLTTGYDLFDARKMAEYGYGQLDNVYTSLDAEYMLNSSGPTGGKILLKNGKEPRAVAIVHCVGSRDTNHHAYCSRICCMYALKFAHLIRDRMENAEVYQFYIDMRAFGKGYEEFYTRILDEGVNVIRGRVAEVVKASWSKKDEGVLLIRCEDTLIRKFREIPVDAVILCGAVEPQKDADRIQRLFSISRSPDGFFLEKHPKLDPTATATDGVFIAGCCQGPKDIPDTVAQASSAAARILAVIAKGEVEIAPITAYIDPELCAGCRLCNDLCPYSAIEFSAEDNISKVIEALCKGCGTCVAACPSSASYQRHFKDEQIFSEIEGVLSDAK